ncbi:MAG: BamA/OMP85 family outer membrane protein [Deltaproteobacteria bacterium]
MLRSFELEGNQAISTAEILPRLATAPSSWLPFSPPKHFQEARFESDLRRIVVFYRARGYFDAKVLSTSVIPDGKNAVRVVVHLEEGLPARVAALEVAGLEELTPEVRGAVVGSLPLEPGEIFTEAGFEADKRRLQDDLRDRSYVTATVEGTATIDPAAHLARVTLRVATGERYRYGRIEIQGNVRVPTRRIEREVLEKIEPGRLYHATDLAEAQRHVFDLGVLSAARVTTGTPDPATGTVPIEVRVREAPFQTTRLGAGLGLDVEHEEIHVTGGYTDRDFFGGLRRLDFDNRLALVWIPTVFAPVFASAAPAGSSTVKLTQPELFTHGLDLTAKLTGERAVEEGFDYWSVRGRLAIPWRVTPKLSVEAAYSAELYLFEDQFNGIDLSPAALLRTDCSTCVLSYLEQSIVWDGRDDPLEPRRGLFASLSLQEGGGPLGGNFSYLRVAPDLRGYLPLGRLDVLASRFQLGGLMPFGSGASTPVTQRFFLGGLDGVRGYGSLRLSPMDRVNTCGVLPCRNPGNSIGVVDIPIGGNGLLEGTVELRHRLSRLWTVVAFVDAGEVTLDPWQFDLSPTALSVTPGVGFRISTPLGPLRADFAYQATDPARPIEQAFGYGNPQAAQGQAAIDTCPYPYGIVPQTGWGAGFTHPSACSSTFLQRFSWIFTIGEAF